MAYVSKKKLGLFKTKKFSLWKDTVKKWKEKTQSRRYLLLTYPQKDFYHNSSYFRYNFVIFQDFHYKTCLCVKKNVCLTLANRKKSKHDHIDIYILMGFQLINTHWIFLIQILCFCKIQHIYSQFKQSTLMFKIILVFLC